MQNKFVAAPLALILLFSFDIASSQQPDIADQGAIAERIRNGSAVEKSSALASISRMGAFAANQELREALRNELTRTIENKRRSKGLGFPTEGDDPEYVVALQDVVADTGDPRAIPLLADSLGDFNLVGYFVDLGESAVPHVIAVVVDPTRDRYAVNDGLRILRMMIENKSLSVGTRQEIRAAAASRLRGQQYYTTLWYAIDLAGVLNDPELNGILQRIADSGDEVRSRGVTIERFVDQTRQRARDRLAGVPALPQLQE